MINSCLFRLCCFIFTPVFPGVCSTQAMVNKLWVNNGNSSFNTIFAPHFVSLQIGTKSQRNHVFHPQSWQTWPRFLSDIIYELQRLPPNTPSVSHWRESWSWSKVTSKLGDQVCLHFLQVQILTFSISPVNPCCAKNPSTYLSRDESSSQCTLRRRSPALILSPNYCHTGEILFKSNTSQRRYETTTVNK